MVKRSDILDQDAQPGDLVNVKFGRRIYKGVLKGTASIVIIRKMMEDFLGTHQKHRQSDEHQKEPLTDTTNHGKKTTKHSMDVNHRIIQIPTDSENQKKALKHSTVETGTANKRHRNKKTPGQILTVVSYEMDTVSTENKKNTRAILDVDIPENTGTIHTRNHQNYLL
jgi:hypothetical protein